MTRVEHIGDATLYSGDCLDVLPTLGKVDAVVTDPPYGTAVTEWDTPISEETVAAVDALAASYSVWFFSNTRLGWLLNALRAAGRDTWIAVWHKSNAMGFERRFAPQWVPIVIAYSGNPPFWGQDLFSCPIAVQDIDHPTPKQVGIVSWCVQRATKPGGFVLDPFMGSGTTGVACANLGRKFIGIEIEPKYFDIACRRIEAAYKQPRLFAEPQPKAVQTSLLDGTA